MKRLAILSCLLAMSACAGSPAGDTARAPLPRLQAATAPGHSKQQVLAALGPTARVVFDSGYETWMYAYGPEAGPGEFVILFGPDGLVKKTRRREPQPAP